MSDRKRVKVWVVRRRNGESNMRDTIGRYLDEATARNVAKAIEATEAADPRNYITDWNWDAKTTSIRTAMEVTVEEDYESMYNEHIEHAERCGITPIIV